MLKVEIVFMSSEQNLFTKTLELDLNSTVKDALNKSGIYTIYPETRTLSLGIFSKPASLDTPLHHGDRIEVYRPLTIDPMEKRRLLARKAKNKKV